MIDEKELREQFKEAIGHQMGRTGKAIMSRFNRELQAAGSPYNAPQMIILANIFHCEGLNQQTVAHMMHRDKAAATRLIDSIEKANLAVRVPDKNDRRSNMIYLTSKGKETVFKYAPIAQKTQEAALKGIDPEEIRIFRQVLDRIYQNVEG